MGVYKTFSKKITKISGHKKTLRSDRFIIFCCAVFLIGSALGAILSTGSELEVISKIAQLCVNDGSVLGLTDNLKMVIIGELIPSLFGAVFLYVMSYCAFGTPLIIAYILMRSIGYGIGAGYLYAAAGLRGILRNLVLETPTEAVSALAIIVFASYAVKQSAEISKFAFGDFPSEKSRGEIVTMPFIRCIVLVILSALLKAVISALFVPILV